MFVKRYFSHDFDAADDPKCQALIADLGMEGYGVYWRLTEMLHNQVKFQKFPKLYHGLARKLHMTTEAAAKQIEALLNEYHLLSEDDNYIWSERVLRNLEMQKAISEQKSRAGQKGGKNSGIARNTKHQRSSASKQTKQNEANEANKIKLNKTKLNQIPSDADKTKLSNLVDNFVGNIKKLRPSKEIDQKEWEDDFVDLIIKDKRSIDEIEIIIEFIKNDSFWSKTVLSPRSLKENFDTLALKAEKIPFSRKPSKPELDDCVKNIVSYTNGKMGCEKRDNCPNSYNGECLQEQAIEEVKEMKGIKL